MKTTSPTGARPGEILNMLELHRIFRQAYGAHPALAEVRRAVAAQIESYTAELDGFGVDTAALLDLVDETLDAEEGGRDGQSFTTPAPVVIR